MEGVQTPHASDLHNAPRPAAADVTREEGNLTQLLRGLVLVNNLSESVLHSLWWS